ncbi:MAG: hypothetical protein WCJ58_00675 [bacterium]
MKYKVIFTTVIFASVFGIISLTSSQIITMDNYILNIIFLSLVALIIILCFSHTFMQIYQKLDKTWLLFLLLSLTIHFTASYLILFYIKRPLWPFSTTGSSFLLLNNYFIWAKPIDVFVQQLLITLLVTRLAELKLKAKSITTIFIFGFGIIHIFQIFKTNLLVGLGYTLVALIFSVVFPYLILKVKNGSIYNYIIHLGAYTLAALLLWTLF